MTDIKTLVSVKPLEWNGDVGRSPVSDDLAYRVLLSHDGSIWGFKEYGRGYFVERAVGFGRLVSGPHETPHEAKAAAQADYESRILSSLSPSREAGEAVACKSCNGLGTEADWVGDDMRCVAVACSACGGMGTITPPTSEPEVSTLKAEVERLRKAAQQVIAANNSFRESIAQFNPGDDPLDEAINSLAAALHEVEEG